MKIITQKRDKFNVTKDKSKRAYKGIVYDSIKEMEFFRDWIEPRMESDEIKKCERQVSYELQEKFIYQGKTILPITYVADYVVEYANGHTVVFDVKGMADQVAILKRKLFRYRYPEIDYRWISYSIIDKDENGCPWILYEKVKSRRSKNSKLKKKKAEEAKCQ